MYLSPMLMYFGSEKNPSRSLSVRVAMSARNLCEGNTRTAHEETARPASGHMISNMRDMSIGGRGTPVVCVRGGAGVMAVWGGWHRTGRLAVKSSEKMPTPIATTSPNTYHPSPHPPAPVQATSGWDIARVTAVRAKPQRSIRAAQHVIARKGILLFARNSVRVVRQALSWITTLPNLASARGRLADPTSPMQVGGGAGCVRGKTAMRRERARDPKRSAVSWCWLQRTPV